MAEQEAAKHWGDSMLSAKDREDFQFVTKRIHELQLSRQDHYGVNLDTLWSEADRAYVPHRLKNKGKRVVATDEDKGWRGALVTLGSNDWQSDVSQANTFVKIQTALSILIDQNPRGVFSARSKRYEKATELMRQLYERSWEMANSRPQLQLFVYNLAKYGWAAARTYPLRVVQKVKVMTEYDQDNPDKSVYEEKEVVEYNDVMRENLDPRNVWIDDMAKPNNTRSVRDWCWRKVYDYDVAKQEFGRHKDWKYVKSGGNIAETVQMQKGAEKNYAPGNQLVEVFFYENRVKDLFFVIANGVPVVLEPLPIADTTGVKKLSLWQTYWNLRHAESVYGIGIYEAIRYDQALLDRIRNMSIDQLTLSIYKMFFYQGTQALTETGDITISPGVGKQVLDPKNITWLDVPGPGSEAWEGIERFKKDVDEASGVGDPLLGTVTGKTAFEIAQAREAALKRLKSPLNNILEALSEEGYITVALIQLLYSIPETLKISDPVLIDDYLKEIGGDPELFERDEEGNFSALVFPEFPLNLDRDEEGNLFETEETRFFRVKPNFLKWDGIVNIKAQSLLTPSKEIDKALALEMYNILIPLLGNPPEIYSKVAKAIVKLYDLDARDILPSPWLQDYDQMAQEMPPGMPPGAPGSPMAPPGPQSGQEPLFVNAGQNGSPMTGAPTLTSSPELPQRPQGVAGKISGALSGLFRRV